MRKPINLTLPMLGRNAQIQVGGVDIADTCSALTVRSSATGTTTVELHLVPDGVQLTGEAAIALPDATHAALVALGWNPPDHDDQERALALLREPSTSSPRRRSKRGVTGD